MSYPFASRYVDQFPRDKTVQIARFVAFVTGALVSVLALASVIDPELFLNFEITPDRTVLFYVGVFGTLWAVVRGMVPEENLVFDPEYALNNVVGFTHYLPSQWRGRLHSDEVKREFTQLYQMKIIIFVEEVLSIITTPFVLWFSLPDCSDKLVDFFREFTVHVDGLGYVCSFAVFDFKKGGNNAAQPMQPVHGTNDGQDLRDEYYSTRDGKMLASYYNFLDNYTTNPKAGAPYHHSPIKSQFHPPPVFPGLMSHNLGGEGNVPGGGRSDNWDRQARGASRYGGGGPASASQRVTRFAPAGTQASPMTSVLLDPQHQPPQSTQRAGFRTGIHSRVRAPRTPVPEVIEDNEDDYEQQESRHGNVIDSAATGESRLGDSWKTTRAGAMDEDDDGEGGVVTGNGDSNQGVLGLVYQFSKAQTEGRGAGVHI